MFNRRQTTDDYLQTNRITRIPPLRILATGVFIMKTVIILFSLIGSREKSLAVVGRAYEINGLIKETVKFRPLRRKAYLQVSLADIQTKGLTLVTPRIILSSVYQSFHELVPQYHGTFRLLLDKSLLLRQYAPLCVSKESFCLLFPYLLPR